MPTMKRLKQHPNMRSLVTAKRSELEGQHKDKLECLMVGGTVDPIITDAISTCLVLQKDLSVDSAIEIVSGAFSSNCADCRKEIPLYTHLRFSVVEGKVKAEHICAACAPKVEEPIQTDDDCLYGI